VNSKAKGTESGSKKEERTQTRRSSDDLEERKQGAMWESLSCLLTLLESFDKNNPEMGTESVARQVHHKTAQHSWVNIVKQQVAGGVCPTPRDTFNSAN